MSVLLRYIGGKGKKKEPVHHAKFFTMEDIASLFKIPTKAMTQTRDVPIIDIGICTLANFSKYFFLLRPKHMVERSRLVCQTCPGDC